jgi:catechol 2,3-dioxygenase-like lactoylglutathione lyase family enzyme
MLSTSKLQTIICTSRIDEAEKFYSSILGLQLKGKSIGALVYQVGNGTLRISPVPSAQPSDHTVLGFAVSNIRDAVSELKARGVGLEKFADFPHGDDGIVRIPDGTQVAWFRDPDRNLLSVVQYLTEDGISS